MGDASRVHVNEPIKTFINQRCTTVREGGLIELHLTPILAAIHGHDNGDCSAQNLTESGLVEVVRLLIENEADIDAYGACSCWGKWLKLG